jgi:hypothetical protein
MKTPFVLGVCGLLSLTGWSSAHADGHVLANKRITVEFATSANGYTKTDSDRVDSLTWIDSAGTSTANLAVSGGPLHCDDPQEFFGQSYGMSANGNKPYLVIAGVTSSYKSSKSNPLAAGTVTNPKKVCDNSVAAPTTTHYKLTNVAARVNQISLKRTFDFKTLNTQGPIRVYVPRLSLATYPIIIWLDAKGVVQHGNANNCGADCEITDWNGAWVADDDGAGDGMVLIRNPALGLPAFILADNDGDSASNDTSIALSEPTRGWKGVVEETEHLCLYDANSWPVARQAAGKLPFGCTMPK